jgi:hypothetical protein
MNNEPVAWMVENDEDISFIMNGKGLAEPDNSWKNVTPVYTHPVKELTVTFDDCIAASLEQDVGYGGDLDLLEFARAILRKAQEK